jgi:hypothetical protein
MDKIVNQFIPRQFPSFYNQLGQNFIAFTKAYFEWMEQSGNPVHETRSLLDYMDIDSTKDAFLTHFQNEYMLNLPTNMAASPRLLIKHIIDLYRSKGTPRGYELLFRILFNEDIRIYIPGNDIFKPSDNTWVVQGYIETTDSDFLQQMVGQSVYSSSSGASALVENYNIINTNDKVINVLTLSSINGVFKYGEFLLSHDIPALNLNNAPLIIGSLSAVSITSGGIFFKIGDPVSISGTGSDALGRVIGTRSENGKVIFNLLNGGQGFTQNAQIQVVGGDGTGATFSIGSLVDKTVFEVSTDEILTYYNTQLDIASEGFTLNISNTSGAFEVGEVINAYSNGIALDFAYLSSTNLANGEVLSNTSLGISGLTVVEIDNPNFVNLTGPEASLNNANLHSGAILLGGSSGAQIYINSSLGKVQYLANGTLTNANSTVLVVDNANGYFLATSNVHGQTSSASAYLNQTVRNTNWLFPGDSGNSNLDSEISAVLSYESLIIGTIASLVDENPGDGYSSNPVVTITEPLIFQLQIPDGTGGFLGGDANVSATAQSANGIMTAIQITSSGFGFSPNEPLDISSPSNPDVAASGVAIVDGTGVSPGYWKNNKSFPSDQIFIEDDFYYQVYSYEIIAPRMLDTYEKFVTDIVQPVGTKMFGRFAIIDTQSAKPTLISSNAQFQ